MRPTTQKSDLLLTPNWRVPKNIHSFTTLSGTNNDFDLSKDINRHKLNSLLDLPTTPAWLKQTHSNLVTEAYQNENADASFTSTPNQVCVVLTADCLPLLICHKNGNKIAAIHAGWRGLANGIIKQAITKGQFEPKNTIAWLGPAISAKNYEVGFEVRDKFLAIWQSYGSAFTPTTKHYFKTSLYQLASLQLKKLGINEITGGTFCTFEDNDRFFSYRRKKETGRMATLIWMSSYR